MIKITQNFYQAKTRMAIHRWFITLCLTVALWMGSVEQVKAQVLARVYYSTMDATLSSGASWGTVASWTYPAAPGWASPFTTSAVGGGTGASGIINFSPGLVIGSNGTNKGKLLIKWGSASNRSVQVSINGATAVQIDAITVSADRSQIRTASYDIPTSVTSPINSIKILTPGGSGTVILDIEVQSYLSCTPATITGTATTSVGSTTQLSANPTGGTWSSGNTGVATVDALSGVVSGVGVGTATITYTLSGCPATQDVTVLGQNKYFRSKANGVWSAAGTWEVSDDGNSGWVTADNAPDAKAKGIEIASGTTVTLGASLTTPVPEVNNIIQVNGILTVATGQALTLGGDMLVNSNGKLILPGTAGSLITNSKKLTVLGTLLNTTSGTVNNAITANTANELVFATPSGAGVYELAGSGTAPQIPKATWVNGTNYSKILFTTSGTIVTVLNDLSATFGDVEFKTTNTALIRGFGSVTSGTQPTMRNLTITSAGTGGIQLTGGTTTATFTVTGDYSQAAGSVAVAYPNANITLNVAGNFSLASGATFTSTGGTGTVVFNGNTLQTYSGTGTTSGTIGFVVNNSTGVVLDAPITANTITVTSGTLTVKSGKTLTVQNAVVNNAGANGIVIENNANLIQVSNAVNTGVVTVNRNSNALYRLDYTMWSSPVSGSQTLADFSPLTLANRFYTYNSSTNLYNSIASTASFQQGKGYLIRMPDNADAVTAAPYAGQFTGVPNNGTVSLTGLTAGQYVAVGNPYPSTISANAFIDANADVPANGVLYYWRKTNNINQGTSPTTSYATYTKAGGVANGGFTPGADIQVGQGFITTVPSTGVITFTNAMRSSNNSAQFLRTKVTAEKDRVWLNLSAGTNPVNQMLVAYMDGATQGVDAGIDGKYINDSALALTSSINGEEYVIQGRPAFDASDVVPLNFKTDTAGNYTIAIDHADGVFAAGQDVILVDAAAGTETSLKSGSYTFTAPAGTANSRFSLKYQKTLGVNDAVYNESNVTVYKNKGVVTVNSAVAIAGVKVYDIQGRLLAELKDVKASSAAVSGLKASNQVLVVQVTLEDNTVVTKKVVN